MTDCIEAKHVHKSGYGRAWLSRTRDIRAHRLAWIQKWGGCLMVCMSAIAATTKDASMLIV